MRTFIHKIFLASVFIVFVLSAVLVQPAAAGTNGQQIFVYMPSKAFWTPYNYPGYKTVTISGGNQENFYLDPVTKLWYGRPTTKTYNVNGLYGIITTGYWWKGPVRIDIVFTNLRKTSCWASVPFSMSGNTYEINCPYPEVWK